jgi:hypothetical protein
MSAHTDHVAHVKHLAHQQVVILRAMQEFGRQLMHQFHLRHKTHVTHLKVLARRG